MKSIITNNSDFLFIYEAIQCNPNGDPDEENKPRMDKDTSTNLVTDVRVKRYIRDYLKQGETDIFVDMEGDRKVNMETRLEGVFRGLLANPAELKTVFESREDMEKTFNDIVSGKVAKKDKKDKKDKKEEEPTLFAEEETGKKEAPKNDPFKLIQEAKNTELNNFLLTHLVKEKFTDIRLFGSAFAVGSFAKTFTGPVQLNWGYSLHPVQLMESDAIVTIMSDDSSTFGKDYRVHYSLLAFHGSINKHAAKSTGMTQNDLELFRNAIWESIPANPTRSKLNQYPKMYLEIIYNEGFTNGQFGDLRQYVKATAKMYDNGMEKPIRSLTDLDLDFSGLKRILDEDKHKEQPCIQAAYLKTAAGIVFKIA